MKAIAASCSYLGNGANSLEQPQKIAKAIIARDCLNAVRTKMKDRLPDCKPMAELEADVDLLVGPPRGKLRMDLLNLAGSLFQTEQAYVATLDHSLRS